MLMTGKLKKCKKILVALLAALSVALLLIFSIRPNDTSIAETSVKVLGDDGIYHNVDSFDVQTDSDVHLNMKNEKIISELLSEFDWVNSAHISISSDNSAVTGVLDTIRNPSQTEIDQVIEMIISHLNGIKKENIIITDKNNNIIYPVSE